MTKFMHVCWANLLARQRIPQSTTAYSVTEGVPNLQIVGLSLAVVSNCSSTLLHHLNISLMSLETFSQTKHLLIKVVKILQELVESEPIGDRQRS